MKNLWFIPFIALSLGGCMTAAQKAQQQAQIGQMLSQMTPEQKGELAKEILEYNTGINQPQPTYQPTYVYPVYQRPVQTQCYTYPSGYTYCW